MRGVDLGASDCQTQEYVGDFPHRSSNVSCARDVGEIYVNFVMDNVSERIALMDKLLWVIPHAANVGGIVRKALFQLAIVNSVLYSLFFLIL